MGLIIIVIVYCRRDSVSFHERVPLPSPPPTSHYGFSHVQTAFRVPPKRAKSTHAMIPCTVRTEHPKSTRTYRGELRSLPSRWQATRRRFSRLSCHTK